MTDSNIAKPVIYLLRSDKARWSLFQYIIKLHYKSRVTETFISIGEKFIDYHEISFAIFNLYDILSFYILSYSNKGRLITMHI